MTSALSVAREWGFEWVACASTGNTSAAMAAYAARAGMSSGLHPGREDCVGKALQPRWTMVLLPFSSHRLRRLRECPERLVKRFPRLCC